jgi:hypothetical protein
MHDYMNDTNHNEDFKNITLKNKFNLDNDTIDMFNNDMLCA